MSRNRRLLWGAVVPVVATVMYLAWTEHPNRPAEGGQGAAPATGVADLTGADITVAAADLFVQVTAPNRPLRAFSPNRLLFRVARQADGSNCVTPADPLVSFTMAMPMGDHRYALVPAQTRGWYQADVVLPACPSGNRRWFGTLEFVDAGAPRRAQFVFDLAPKAP
jgi:hypothetical protein